MPIELFKMCVVALLSLDAEQQANEVHTLLNQPWQHTQLAACLQAHATTLDGTEIADMAQGDDAPVGTFSAGAGDPGNLYPKLKTASDEAVDDATIGTFSAGAGDLPDLYPKAKTASDEAVDDATIGTFSAGGGDFPDLYSNK